MTGPVDATRIPDWCDRSHPGLVRWWQQMVSQHLAFHPEDRPETVMCFYSGKPLFSASACTKLAAIISDMVAEHGSEVYRVAESEVITALQFECHENR